MATRSKRARPDSKAAENTTAQDNMRCIRTQHKIQQPSRTSRAKSFPKQTSQVIDLTLSDKVEEVFPAYSSRSTARQDQAEEQSHSKYALRSKTSRTPQRVLANRSWDDQSIQDDALDLNEGEQRWAPLPKPRVSTDEHARYQQQGERDRKKNKPTRKERKKMGLATHTLSSAAAVMFTIPEAMTALARSQLTRAVAYDLPTGAYLSYPVKRSYHLGAMGRYGNTRVAMYTSLPYRPSSAAKGNSRFNKLRSD